MFVDSYMQTEPLVNTDFGVVQQSTWEIIPQRVWEAIRFDVQRWAFETEEANFRRQLLDRYDGVLLWNSHLRAENNRLQTTVQKLQQNLSFYAEQRARELINAMPQDDEGEDEW